MKVNGSNLITQSRLRCLKLCARKHYYAYEAGITTQRESEALRMGRIYHVALDALALGKSLEQVFAIITDNYATMPQYADAFDWAVEREKVMRLICGYVWFWRDEKIEILATESVFSLPILNPETRCPTPLFSKAGKIDKKIRLESGIVGVMEHKTTSDSIEGDSEYWDILRLDPQISMYFTSDPTLQTILYDVTRKPATKPSQTKTHPKAIKDDYKLFGRWYGEVIEGATAELPERETVQMYGARLAADITENPARFYARREVGRTEADVEAFNLDLWQDQLLLRHRQKLNLWPRTPSADTCSWCEFKRPCFANIYPINSVPPEGFVFKSTVHPELETTNGNSTSNQTAPDSAAVETEQAAYCAVTV